MNVLYDKILNVSLNCVQSESQRRFRIHISDDGRQPVREIFVRLTDPQNYHFLACLTLNEDDFQVLKNEQGILVDFGSFGQRFIDLLDLCLADERREVARYVLTLKGGGSQSNQLMIIELNPFKHLTHLSIRVPSADDQQLKSYLADCLKNLSRDFNQLEKTSTDQIESLKSEKQQLQSALTAKSVELDERQSSWEEKAANLSDETREQMERDRTSHVREIEALRAKHELDQRQLEEAHAKVIRDYEVRLREAKESAANLADKRYRLEASVREWQQKSAALQEDVDRLSIDLTQLRREVRDLSCERHEFEKENERLKTRLDLITVQLSDKENVSAKANELLESERMNSNRLLNDIDQRKRRCEKLEKNIETLSGEVNKANDIINKLQNQLQNMHNKVRMRGQIAEEQENVLKERNAQLSALRTESDTLRATNNECELRLKELERNIEEALRALSEARNTIANNDNVINWLNKQITELQVKPKAPPPNNFSRGIGGPQANSTALSAIPRPSTIPRAATGHAYPAPQPQPVASQSERIPSTTPSPINHHQTKVTAEENSASTTMKENALPLDEKYLQPLKPSTSSRALLSNNSSYFPR